MRREAKRALLNIAGCVRRRARRTPRVKILRKTFPHDDALLDAAAATAHDYDDTHLRTVIHATPPVAGALFSLARREASAGREFLHAFILGMETTCRLGNAVTPGHYERGWHITSTCGVFGAAAAAGKILELNEQQFRHALGHRRDPGRRAWSRCWAAWRACSTPASPRATVWPRRGWPPKASKGRRGRSKACAAS